MKTRPGCCARYFSSSNSLNVRSSARPRSRQVYVHSSIVSSPARTTPGSPAEVEARFRLAIERSANAGFESGPQEISAGELTVDAGGYTARVRGRPLDLTYKEFELIKYLVQHPGRVFTRAQLLQEVWGYDYYGGTRTVDVHVRRLRAKLGPEHEQLIGTVRNVGYRFDPPKDRAAASGDPASRDPASGDVAARVG